MAPGSAIGIVGGARLDLAAREPLPSKLPPARLARMDRLCGLALIACEAALADAGLTALDGDRTAIVFGTVYGCHATNEEYEKSRATGASPRLFAYTLPSSPTGEIAIQHRLRGPALTFASGGTAPLDALATATRLLRDGRADRALVVSAEVTTPWLVQLARGAPTRELAAALILERSGGATRERAQLVGVGAAFHAGEPQSALSAVLNDLDAAEATKLDHAAGPLGAIAGWLASARGDACVTATDEAGGAAAALVRAP